MRPLPAIQRHASGRLGEASDRVKQLPFTCSVVAIPMLSPRGVHGVSILMRVRVLGPDSWATAGNPKTPKRIQVSRISPILRTSIVGSKNRNRIRRDIRNAGCDG